MPLIVNPHHHTRLRLEEHPKHLAHVHVLGFAFEQLGQRIRHRLKAATEVEPHGVLRWRRRDDDVAVASGAGDLLELLAQKCQVRDPGPKL